MRDDGSDLALLLEVIQALAGQGTVDLEPVDKGGDGDQAVGLDILVQLVRGGLVEDDGVLGLVLDCMVSRSVSVLVLRKILEYKSPRAEIRARELRYGRASSVVVAVVHRTTAQNPHERVWVWKGFFFLRTLSLGPLLLLLLRAGVSGSHLVCIAG